MSTTSSRFRCSHPWTAATCAASLRSRTRSTSLKVSSLHEGSFAYELMVIEDGRAEVVRDGEHVADPGPGDVLREIAALEQGRRNTSVIARSRMSLVVMTARDLRQLGDGIPKLGEAVRSVAAERHPLAQAK